MKIKIKLKGGMESQSMFKFFGSGLFHVMSLKKKSSINY